MYKTQPAEHFSATFDLTFLQLTLRLTFKHSRMNVNQNVASVTHVYVVIAILYLEISFLECFKHKIEVQLFG